MYCLTSINDFITLVNDGGAIIILTVIITLYETICYLKSDYYAIGVNLRNVLICFGFGFCLINYLLTYFGYKYCHYCL